MPAGMKYLNVTAMTTWQQITERNTRGAAIMNDCNVSRKFLINKVLETAQDFVDTDRKGWRVKMREFHDAMDAFDFSGREVREAIAFLEARMIMISFTDHDGHIYAISVVPQRYRCEFCNMWLDMQDDPEDHIDLCRRLQAKMKRNRELLDSTKAV
jgi:hypothetical protein